MCQSDRRRRYEQRHREKGLCHKCSNVAVEGRVRCEKHLSEDADRVAKRRDRWRRDHLCPQCGRPLTPSDEGFIMHNRNECNPSRRMLA